MKIKLNKFLLLCLFFLIVASAIFGYKYLSTTYKSILKDEQTTGQQIKTTNFNQIELEEYYQTYKNPFVLYLREALNAYLSNELGSVNLAPTAIKKNKTNEFIIGLDSFDKDYYKSRYVVLSFNKNIGGGVDLEIMFQDKPDRIFYAWVYKLADGNYELRGFSSKENFDPERIKELNKAYSQFLLDKEHAL